MTFPTVPPPVTFVTGLNLYALLDFFEELDTDSAGMLARAMLHDLAALEKDYRELLELPLVKSYVQRIRQACEITAGQCPATDLSEDHQCTIERIAHQLQQRIRLRMWFLSQG